MNTVAKEKQGNPPYFPPKNDEDQRIRMGCPLDEEDLLHRYREVVSGTSPKDWTREDYLFAYRFEWALADIMACSMCKATGRADCRSVKGERYFMDMHRLRTAETGRPVFVMTLCQNPLTRMAQIAGRQVDYR